MTDRHLLEQLRDLLVRLEIDVRDVRDVGGGICRVGSRRVLMANLEASPGRQIALLCRELSRLDLSQVFVLPAVRRRIEAQRPSDV